MRPPLRGPLLVAVLLASLSCGEPVGLEDGLRIRTTSEAVLLTNATAQGSLFSFVMAKDMAAHIDFMPCVIPGSCGEVLPGATRRFERNEHFGDPGEEVHVYWWRAVPGVADAPEVGPISVERVWLRSPLAP